MLKKVLFIAYQIPPIGGAATQRHIRFLTRLPALDWHPVVLTVDPAYCEEYYPKDETLLSLLPSDIPIYRTKSFNPMDRLLKIKASIRRGRGDIAARDRPAASNSCHSSPCGNPVQFCKDIVTEIFRIPDRQIGWYLFAVLTGIRIIRKEEIRVIYSSGNPWTSHLVGMSLAKLSRLPWVADFRDPWTGNPYKKGRTGFIQKIEQEMEKRVVASASFVIANTRALRQQFIDSYPSVDPRKFVHISNGYLAELFQDLPQEKEDSRMIISHVGTLYSHRSPLPLLKAVSRLKKLSVLTRENFLLRFIGVVGVPGVNEDFLKKLEIDDVVKFVGPVSHSRALSYLACSDVLLIIQPGTRLQIPSKLFEYIAVRKAIFAITGPGATADIIHEEGLGEVAAPEDIDDIVIKLQQLHQKYECGTLNRTMGSFRFDRYESLPLTRRLASVLQKSLSLRRTGNAGNQ
ncbi:MAG: glycosyltransferase [Nitrospiraceae bacterium]|nr:glycosyltransferase [Nitrospiraceae bacterium]